MVIFAKQEGAGMNICEIHTELLKNSDSKYREFQLSLLPTLDAQTIIGVRTPILRGLAKTLYKQNDFADFIAQLPHRYFDENQLHAFLISEIKDFDLCIYELNRFLPFVDNWATCDQMSPKIFKKHNQRLPDQIKIWLASSEPYTVRFAVRMLMQYFLDEDFEPEYPRTVCAIRSGDYYVNMTRAWYFATALAKQYEAVLPFFEEKHLDKWTHNKTIQKALESYRISDDRKKHLRTLKV